MTATVSASEILKYLERDMATSAKPVVSAEMKGHADAEKPETEAVVDENNAQEETIGLRLQISDVQGAEPAKQSPEEKVTEEMPSQEQYVPPEVTFVPPEVTSVPPEVTFEASQFHILVALKIGCQKNRTRRGAFTLLVVTCNKFLFFSWSKVSRQEENSSN